MELVLWIIGLDSPFFWLEFVDPSLNLFNKKQSLWSIIIHCQISFGKQKCSLIHAFWNCAYLRFKKAYKSRDWLWRFVNLHQWYFHVFNLYLYLLISTLVWNHFWFFVHVQTQIKTVMNWGVIIQRKNPIFSWSLNWNHCFHYHKLSDKDNSQDQEIRQYTAINFSM